MKEQLRAPLHPIRSAVSPLRRPGALDWAFRAVPVLPLPSVSHGRLSGAIRKVDLHLGDAETIKIRMNICPVKLSTPTEFDLDWE